MGDWVKQRKSTVELLARGNEQSRIMLRENAELERRYNAVLSQMTTEQMDIICDFLMHCEAMSNKMLDLVCSCMRFPG